MFDKLRQLLCAATITCIAASPAFSQEPAEAPAEQPASAATEQEGEENEFTKFVNSLDWKTDGTGTLGSLATLDVPEGFRFTGQSGTVKLMEAYGNLTSGAELGYISPLDMDWFAVFEFDECGYVKDDEKDKLDAAAILKQLQDGQQAANKELTKRGMPTLQVIGWKTPPFYNKETNNLEWAIRLRSGDGGEVVNYRTKLLGRRGVMDVVLVCDEAGMSSIIPQYQELLKGYAFKKEESYAAYSKGDKVAEYGLTGLIVGGGLLVAAKSGLLAKLWKPIVGGVVVVGMFLKRIFVGKTQESI